MNYYSVFYWLTVADGVKKVFDTFSDIFTLLTVISLVAYVIIIAIAQNEFHEKTPEENDIKVIGFWRKFIARTYWTAQVICIITWLGYVMTPTKKDCLLIVAGGAVGNFITTDSSAKSLPSDVTRFLHLSLNKEIDDIQKETTADIRKELGVQTKKEQVIDKLKQLSKEEAINFLQSDTTLLK